MTTEIEDSAVDPPRTTDGFFEPPAVGSADRTRELELRYRGIIDRLPAVLYVDAVDQNQPMIDVSPSVHELLGIPREEFLSRPYAWTDTIHPDDLAAVMAENERSAVSGDPFRMEFRVVHPDGRILWVRDDAVLIHDESGAPLHWLGLMLDVTELIEAQAELHQARTKYGALVEQIPAIVYVDAADDEMSTTYVSPQIQAILGYTAQEYIDDPQLWERMLHPDDRENAVATYLRGRESGGPFVFEYRLIAHDGRTVWFRDSAIVLTDEQGRAEHIQGVMLDITERKIAEERIAFLAYHDKLTGLPNRTMFDELLGLALARAKRHELGVVVVTVDLDDFKLVNDSLGHEAGDAILMQFAQRLSDATRETDLVARPGGDEFLLLLADLDRASSGHGGHESVSVSAESVALRIQEALRTPFAVGDYRALRDREPGDQRVPGRRGRRTDAAQERGDGDVPVEAVRAGRVRPAREGRRRLDRAAVAVHAAAAGRGAGAVDAALPAADRPAHHGDERRRGVDPLARTERGPRAARRLHPARGGDGPDRGDRRVGDRRGLPAGSRVAGAGTGSRHLVQSVAPAALAEPTSWT